MDTHGPLARIRQVPDPSLAQRATHITRFDKALKTLSEFMTEIMETHNGVGLAANQIGISQDMFVYDAGDGPRFVANGRIVDAQGVKFSEEGCLSMHGWCFSIPRARHIVWEGQDLRGHPIRGEASDLEARIIQHETDHLRGRSLLNYVSKHDKLLVLGLAAPSV
jgi:peptide deformylase